LHRFRIFTLDQANALLPTIAQITERSRDELKRLESGAADGQSAPLGDGENDASEVVQRWAHTVMAFGAQPKGVFTVDFRSPDPNLLWCWAPAETEICHRHFTWESFRDRISLSPDTDFWPGRN
jgi:hypothetical protein